MLPELAIGSVSPESARQDFALVLDHVTVVVFCASNSVSASESVAVGAFQPVMVACAFALPPAPEQLSVKVEAALVIAIDCDPVVASVPLQSPDAVHERALVDVQVSVTLPPMRASLVDTLRLAVGATGVGGVLVLPPPPPPPPQEASSVKSARMLARGSRWRGEFGNVRSGSERFEECASASRWWAVLGLNQ